MCLLRVEPLPPGACAGDGYGVRCAEGQLAVHFPL